MKKIITILAVTVITCFSIQAQTNVTDITTNTPAAEYNKIDFTIGGSGMTISGYSEVGLDVSVSVNPFKKLPDVWIGAVQGLYWEPAFAGSTDFDVVWNQHIYKDLYLNAGWSVGGVYSKDVSFFRTGPELIAQFYTSEDSFIYAGANYDLTTKHGDDGLRWNIGIGLEF
jgi:hypothetical protein